MKKIVVALLIVAITVYIFIYSLRSAITNDFSPVDNEASSDWWDTNFNYRIPITVNTSNYERVNKPVEIEINFSKAINKLNQTEAFEIKSLRLIEVNKSGEILDVETPFQFDKAGDYNQKDNAKGTLIFLMKEGTEKNSDRYYYVYFGTTSRVYPEKKITKQLEVMDNVSYKGFSSIRVITTQAEYFYHKTGGGFATLLDSDKKDWLSWNTTEGAKGDYRGLPNMVHPNDGGFFHPGRDSSTTSLVSDGPLKVSFRSISKDGKWQGLWEVFPEYARFTVEKVPTDKAYWFLYEGVPGGSLDLNKDKMTRSDGKTILASQELSEDIPGEEWVFFSDELNKRSLYLIHNQEDNFIDGYFHMNDMTVFGFGRNKNSRYLKDIQEQFIIGFVDSTSFDKVGNKVHNAYKSLNITQGNPEFYKGLPIDPIVTNSPTPINTLQATQEPTNRPTVINTPRPTSTVSPKPEGNKCGSSDVNGDGRLTLIDFSEFAIKYKIGNTRCSDTREEYIGYGKCGGKDVDRSGVLDIKDFGGYLREGGYNIGFARRYFPKESCDLPKEWHDSIKNKP